MDLAACLGFGRRSSRWSARLFVALALVGLPSSVATAIVVGQLDDFQDGTTQGWVVGTGFGVIPPVPPANAMGVGPAGLGDDALRLTGIGGLGAGSKLVVDHLGAAWTGDYTAAGVGAIRLNVNNLVASPLTIRLALEPPSGVAGGGIWITPGEVVPALSGWTTLEFRIQAGDLIAPIDDVASDAAATLANVGRLRILHAAGNTFRGDPIAGQLDIDNVEALPRPITVGQLDDFQDGTTQGWAVGTGFGVVPPVPPANAMGVGPAGLGDDALRLTGIGGVGPGSKLVVDNLDAAWTGDYTAAGVGAIVIDVNNLVAAPLTIRLALEPPPGGAGGGTWITPGSVVPVLSGWTTLEFGIEAGDLIAPVDAVATDAAATLADVGRLRILHAAGDTFRGDSIMGQLDIDNIEAVPEPSAALAAFASLATLCALRVVRLARGTRRCS